MKKIQLLIFFCIFSLSSKAQRNVVLLIADDLSPDYFGFYENHLDTVDVPNIRALLNKGVRFKNLMSNPVCSSTRTTILTGRYSFRTGVGNIVGGTGGSNQIDTSETTIPKLLKIYNPLIAKANIGKWHLTQPNPASHLVYPNLIGYDHFEGPFIGQLPSYTNWTKITDGISSTVTNYATTENVNNAVAWVKTVNPTAPFFLWLAFNAPHEPLHLPPSGLHSATNLTGTPADINANPKSYFKAMIQALDHEIGRLFDSLQVLNRMDSTDIIFIGDNGNTPRTAQIADLTKAKGTIYQYGVHVPMLIAGPSVINPGRVSDALINTADIFSTVLELMGDSTWQSSISANRPVDSKSILPILKNQLNTIRPWSFCELFKLTPDSADGKAIRNTDYKLIRFDYGQQAFYNLAVDSNESVNLLATPMSSIDSINYTYLCTEMANLIGGTSPCLFSLGLNSISTPPNFTFVYPNPFYSKLTISSDANLDWIKLSNCLGQVIYAGKFIESIDFSELSDGIYYLQTQRQNQIFNFKLIHTK